MTTCQTNAMHKNWFWVTDERRVRLVQIEGSPHVMIRRETTQSYHTRHENFKQQFFKVIFPLFHLNPLSQS